MVKVVKYTAVVPVEVSAECGEKSAECEGTATLHVCFEDGSGVSVCRNCLDERVNEGQWITDACQILLAS
jgi:hypothetical protein